MEQNHIVDNLRFNVYVVKLALINDPSVNLNDLGC